MKLDWDYRTKNTQGLQKSLKLLFLSNEINIDAFKNIVKASLLNKLLMLVMLKKQNIRYGFTSGHIFNLYSHV